ncbi:DDB1- and CUL4-associated factor 11-like [Anneissia japonica]|uniref:DDB1- and CUL4-associated factor 11-like n=1 Tax=Anneissia japonica TaxID=1529436 RepID=UPI00142566CF|nr:DDB1- and CUL4-associated factor 11-like [Anneissia japonica]
MGSRHTSGRERDPEDVNEGTFHGNDDSDDDYQDYAAVLAYLLRSGTVRFTSSRNQFESDTDSDSIFTACVPEADQNPDTSKIDESDLKQEFLHFNCCKHNEKPYARRPIPKMLVKRMHSSQGGFTQADRCEIISSFLPNHMEVLKSFQSKVFCGTYSKDGTVFMSACQDKFIRLYDTTYGQFKQIRCIPARDIGWSIIDTAFSPDGCYLIYSSWSDKIHLCNIYGDYETHTALDLRSEEHSHFCAFTVNFSNDNREILAGANDGCIYVYDREKSERILKIDAHEDDLSAVIFADDSSHIIYSGADDGMCKVWDRRCLSEICPNPVGVFAGHTDGLTYVDSKGDSRYLITNSKDQTIKLWDMRRFASKETIHLAKKAVAQQNWDYRFQRVPRRSNRKKNLKDDPSLMTYKGHAVLQTLVRCYFSPAFTTGQRYIYTGCASGAVVIYDVLTGKVVSKLKGHEACVRDISWHPFDNNIISTSWDATHGFWEYRGQKPYDRDVRERELGDSDSDDDSNDEDNDNQKKGTVKKRRLHRLNYCRPSFR